MLLHARFSNTIMGMFKNEKVQKIFGLVFTVLLIGLVGWYITRDISTVDIKQDGQDVIESESLEDLVKDGSAEVEEIPVDVDLKADSVSRPNLDRAIILPSRFLGEAETIVLNNISTLVAQLKEDPNSFQAWSDLATQYKIIDDFEGSAEIWEFLSIATGDNIDTRINLGNLYHYHLRDFLKSEEVFKEVLDINSNSTEAYTGLHELYRYSYKTDTFLAVDILKEGIEVIPNNIDLRMLLASYYTELDMFDEAKVVYEEVLVMAEATDNTNLISIIKAAIDNLK